MGNLHRMQHSKADKKRLGNFLSLKTRVLIIFSFLTLFFLLVDYGIQTKLIFPTYLALEKSEALQNLERASGSIEREIKHIDIICHDRASSDDLYEYVIRPYAAFEESHLSAGSFTSNRINLIYICDSTGKLLWDGVYNIETGKKISMRNILANPIIRKRLVNFSMDSFPEYYAVPDKLLTSGIINTELGLMMVSSRPILDSDNNGPPRGALIMGRFLNESFLKKLTAQIKVEFNVISLYEKSNVEKYSAVINGLLEGQSVHEDNFFVETTDGSELVVYTLIKDVEDKPAMIIGFSFPRKISRQGMKNIDFAIIYILIIGTVVLILFLFFTNAMILKPLSKLTALIQLVESTGDLSLRSQVERADEIGILSEGFNRMMEKAESHAIEIAESLKQQKREIDRRIAVEEELRLANMKLEELAHIDPLTGIANRRFFGKTMDQEWKRGIREQSPISLILCDIDYFKRYNDTYGHQKGDECLKSVAAVIQNTLRRPPDIAARFGGEEFIVLLPNTAIEGALYLAEKIRKNIRNLNIEHSGSMINSHLSISLGVASCTPSMSSRSEELIEMADSALYRSKENGRNRVSSV